MKVIATSLVVGAGIALTSDDQAITIMLRPGDIKTVSDEMRHAKSIRHAISLGYITVQMDADVSENYLQPHSDFVAQVELQALWAAVSGFSGGSGGPGTSGFSGYSGGSGPGSVGSGESGYSGDSGTSGFSGVFSGASGTSGWSGFSGSGISAGAILNLEMEMEFKTASLLYYKTFSYTGASLTAYNIYTNNTLLVQLFSKALTYDLTGKLTQTVLTRISDSATLTCTYAYTGVNLTSITRT